MKIFQTIQEIGNGHESVMDGQIIIWFNMSTLVGHLCRLLEKGRKEIEEIVEEMKERSREERGTGLKVKKQKK